MKVRGISVSLIIILICATIFFGGCKSDGGSNSSSNNKISTTSLTKATAVVAAVAAIGAAFIAGEYINNNDHVTTRSWHHPANLSDNISPDGQDSYYPQVALDNKGNAIIVWMQSDGANGQIFKSEYRSGVWHHPASLSDNISPDGQSVWSPQVAMDNDGNVIIVWNQYDGANYQIFKSEYRHGIWTHPLSLSDNISPDGANECYAIPHLAMDNKNNAIITWHQIEYIPYDSSYYQIFKSEYRNGAWMHPASIADNISPYHLAWNSQVAMDDNGNAIIVWQQFNGRYYQIFKSEFRNGTWIHPASLSDNISPYGSDAILPQVAMDNEGNAIIVWQQSDGTYDQVFKSEYRNGTWTHPTSLADNISPDGQGYYSPQVEMDNKGNAIIVWNQSDGVNYQIFKSEFRNGVWHHPTSLEDNISPDGQGVLYEPMVSMDNEGNAIIVWSQFDGTNLQIFKSEYRNGAWINPTSFTDNISQDGQDAMNPQVTMGNNGNAIIVWEQFDGDNWQIFKSEYR